MKVEVQNLSVVLGDNTVLRALSFSVPEGASVAVVGQSGTGKTTLLRTIAGLIKPNTGQVCIGGRSPQSLYGTAKLAFLFQEAYLWQHLTVRENLELVYKIHQKSPDPAHITTQLETVGLHEAQDHYPFQLSVGMKTRAAIARALCLPPQLLLMDEPFSALDPVRRTEMNKVVRSTCQALDATSIWVTHDVVEALLFADLIVAMTPAKEVEIFDTRDLPPITDPGALPARVLHLRDRIIGATWERHAAELNQEMNTCPR